MNKEKLIQFLLDREIDVEASKTELFENEPIFRENMVSTTDYAVNRVINYLRERLERERQPFTLRNIAPHLVGMEKNSAICSLVERVYSEQGDESFTNDRVVDAVAMAEISLLNSGLLHPSINSIRELEGKQVDELLGGLLGEADQQCIERPFTEPGYPREISQSLLMQMANWPPEYTDPDEESRQNDDEQICEMLQKDVLDELGLVFDRGITKKEQ